MYGVQTLKRSPMHTMATAVEEVLRGSILAGVPAVLLEFGQDPARVLHEAGLDPALLDEPESMIPFHTAGALLEHCMVRTGCQHFGLLVGQRGGAATLGVVGRLVQNSPSVGRALRNLVKYLHVHDLGAVPTLTVEGQWAMLGYAPYARQVPASHQICALSMAVTQKMMQELCGAEWRASEVLFPFRKFWDTGPYRRFFQAPLRFDTEQAALIFPASWLDRPLSQADPTVQCEIAALIADLDATHRGDTAARVRRAVRTILVGGRAAEEEEVARAFAMHRRTLNRRLRLQGTTFERIAEDVRFEVACHMLRDTDKPVGDIATSLGYAGPSPFGRAFRRWAGSPPHEWRDRNASSIYSQSATLPTAHAFCRELYIAPQRAPEE